MGNPKKRHTINNMTTIKQVQELHLKASDTLWNFFLKKNTLKTINKVHDQMKTIGAPISEEHYLNVTELEDEMKKLKSHYLIELELLKKQAERL